MSDFRAGLIVGFLLALLVVAAGGGIYGAATYHPPKDQSRVTLVEKGVV